MSDLAATENDLLREEIARLKDQSAYYFHKSLDFQEENVRLRRLIKSMGKGFDDEAIDESVFGEVE